MEELMDETRLDVELIAIELLRELDDELERIDELTELATKLA
jgi:hypothetical protein